MSGIVKFDKKGSLPEPIRRFELEQRLAREFGLKGKAALVATSTIEGFDPRTVRIGTGPSTTPLKLATSALFRDIPKPRGFISNYASEILTGAGVFIASLFSGATPIELIGITTMVTAALTFFGTSNFSAGFPTDEDVGLDREELAKALGEIFTLSNKATVRLSEEYGLTPELLVAITQKTPGRGIDIIADLTGRLLGDLLDKKEKTSKTAPLFGREDIIATAVAREMEIALRLMFVLGDKPKVLEAIVQKHPDFVNNFNEMVEVVTDVMEGLYKEHINEDDAQAVRNSDPAQRAKHMMSLFAGYLEAILIFYKEMRLGNAPFSPDVAGRAMDALVMFKEHQWLALGIWSVNGKIVSSFVERQEDIKASVEKTVKAVEPLLKFEEQLISDKVYELIRKGYTSEAVKTVAAAVNNSLRLFASIGSMNNPTAEREAEIIEKADIRTELVERSGYFIENIKGVPWLIAALETSWEKGHFAAATKGYNAYQNYLKANSSAGPNSAIAFRGSPEIEKGLKELRIFLTGTVSAKHSEPVLEFIPEYLNRLLHLLAIRDFQRELLEIAVTLNLIPQNELRDNLETAQEVFGLQTPLEDIFSPSRQPETIDDIYPSFRTDYRTTKGGYPDQEELDSINERLARLPKLLILVLKDIVRFKTTGGSYYLPFEVVENLAETSSKNDIILYVLQLTTYLKDSKPNSPTISKGSKIVSNFLEN